MDKRSVYSNHIAKLGGASIGGAPTGKPVVTTSIHGEPDGPSPIRGLPNFIDRLIGIKELRPMIGNPGVSTIYDWMRDGDFPKPLKVGRQRVAWRLSDIRAWMDSLPQAGEAAA